MKVILISDALDGIIEMDSSERKYDSHDRAWTFAQAVKDSIEGIMRTEDLNKNGKRA